MAVHRAISIFSGRISHPVISLWMLLLSFLYFRWIFWNAETALSIDGIYFGFLLFLSGMYFLYMLSRQRYHVDRAILIHLCAILVAAATLVWSPGKVAGVRELAAMIYVWMFHFFFRNMHPDAVFSIYKAFLSILAALLFLTLVFVLVGAMTGTFIFSPDEGGEIGDMPGYFVMPMDLVSVISFFSLSLIAAGRRRPYYYLLFFLSSALLLLNFSKTYMAATAIAWMAFGLLRSKSVWSVMKAILIFLICLALLVFTQNPLSRQLFFDSNMTIGLFLSSPQEYFYFLNTSGRINIWDYLLTEAFAVNGPWLGAGLGAAREILSHNPFGEAGFAAHSDYVKILADFGLLGVGLYLFVLFALGRRFTGLLRQRKDKLLAVIGSAGFMMTIYLAVGGIGYEMLNRPRSILLAYFAIIGLSFALEKNEKRPLILGNTFARMSSAWNAGK